MAKKLIATGLLGPMVIWILTFFWTIATDIRTLQAKDIGNKEQLNKIEKKIDKIHWYLLERSE